MAEERAQGMAFRGAQRTAFREFTEATAADAATFEKFKAIEAKLNPQASGAIGVKLGQKDLKKLNKQKRELMDAHPGGPSAFLEDLQKFGERDRQLEEIMTNRTQLKDDWRTAAEWLVYGAGRG